VQPKYSWGASPVVRLEYLIQYWRARGTRVALYPAGRFASYLLENTHLAQVLVGIADSDRTKQGMMLGNHPVQDRQALADIVPDIILVASPDWEQDILADLAPLAARGIRLLGFSMVPEVPNPIDLWAQDDAFQERFRNVAAYSLLDERRAYMLEQFARQALALPGDYAEVGVFRGASAVLLGHVLSGSSKRLHLFDTFQGMPETEKERDLFRAGDLANTGLAEVRERLAFCPQADFHPGFFPETATALPSERFAFVHVDVDIHRSVLDCCEFFYPRMSGGGCMVFDDYGYVNCPGAKQAVDTFFADKPEYPCYLPTGQCLVIRHPG